MPTYVYKFIDSGKIIEVQQAFTDEPFTSLADPTDGQIRAVKKVFTPVGVSFKGDGFYKTDSRTKSTASSGAPTATSSGSESPSNGDSKATVATPNSSETNNSPTSAPATKSTTSTPASIPATSTPVKSAD